ncbi:lipopolysaccharide heptosyltransferase II, partial [Candidatus Omnitrophota bacterium]
MKSGDPKKILVIRLDRIGDCMLSVPAIRAVKKAHPESHLAVMVKPQCRDIVSGSPFIDEVILYDKDGYQKGVLQTAMLIAKIRRMRFDLAVILHPTARSHIIPFLAGIPVRAGYDRKMGALLTLKVRHDKQLGSMHEIDYALDLVRHIGCKDTDRRLAMPENEASDRKVRDVFAGAGIGDRPLIVIHPAASCPSKRWPAERFAEAADKLISAFGAAIVIVSGKSESSFGDAVAGSVKGKVLNLSGETSVGELASLLRRSKLLISCDSGPVHIACAVGTPVVAIFGRSDKGLSPKRWGPTGPDDVILHKYVGCETCLAHNCDKGFECL